MRTTSAAGIPVFDFCPPKAPRRSQAQRLSPILGRLVCFVLAGGLFVALPQAAALLQPATAAVTSAR
jgi:hypothetical protein